jgi:hypothetical protein
MADYDEDDLAPYNPQSGVSGVGSGSGFGASLYYLYKAGQIEMPSIAQRYLTLATRVHGAAGQAQTWAPTAGNPAALTGLAEVLDDLHHALNSTVTSVRDCGVALSQVAQTYAASDQEASAAFNARIKDVDGNDDADFGGQAPTVSDPPPVDGPLPTVLPPTDAPELDEPPTPDQPDAELPDDDESGGYGGSGGSTD